MVTLTKDKRGAVGAIAFTAVLVVSLAGIGPVGLGSAAAGTDSDATELDSCTTIDESGTYQLTESLENRTEDVCIDIQASDVYFDGGGHTIDGTVARRDILRAMRPPETGIGLGVNFDSSSQASNVTVTNVTVTDWFFGVRAEGLSGVSVRDLEATASGVGVFVDSASGPVMENVTTSGNIQFGTLVEDSSNTSVYDVTAISNRFNGVLLVSALNSTVRRTTANNNGFSGVELTNSSDTVVRGVTATGNGFRGFGVVDVPTGNVVENVTVADSNFSRNGYSGIVVFNVTNSTFSNNSVVGTVGTLPPGRPSPGRPAAGVHVENGSGNVFMDTDARNQAAWAYSAEGGATNTVETLRTDAAIVSFKARDIALGPTTTAPPNASGNMNTPSFMRGVTTINTSADAFIDLQVTWGTGKSAEAVTRNATEHPSIDPEEYTISFGSDSATVIFNCTYFEINMTSDEEYFLVLTYIEKSPRQYHRFLAGPFRGRIIDHFGQTAMLLWEAEAKVSYGRSVTMFIPRQCR